VHKVLFQATVEAQARFGPLKSSPSLPNRRGRRRNAFAAADLTAKTRLKMRQSRAGGHCVGSPTPVPWRPAPQVLALTKPHRRRSRPWIDAVQPLRTWCPDLQALNPMVRRRHPTIRDRDPWRPSAQSTPPRGAWTGCDDWRVREGKVHSAVDNSLGSPAHDAGERPGACPR